MLRAQPVVSQFPPQSATTGSIPSESTIENWRYQEKETLLSNRRYPYPIFELLSTPGRIGLFSLSATLMALNTMTLKWLYGRVNGFGTSEAPTSKPGDIKKDELHET
jgi:FAR-17a/AIG1-like protein